VRHTSPQRSKFCDAGPLHQKDALLQVGSIHAVGSIAGPCLPPDVFS
jgi:hypothetical protein